VARGRSGSDGVRHADGQVMTPCSRRLHGIDRPTHNVASPGGTAARVGDVDDGSASPLVRV
jgi:hypothetical protein